MSTTVFRVEKNREFVVMNNRFLREKEMSLKAKGLLALCLSLPDTWNYSLNGLCAICKESQTSIRSALKELEQFKYLKRNRKKDNKGQFIYEYVIYEVAYEEKETGKVDSTTISPYTENLHTDNRHIENLSTENNRVLNIEKENIKEQSIKKDNLYIKNLHSIITSSVTNKEIRELYKEYVAMRESIGYPLTERGLKMLITRCERLSNMNIRIQKLLLEAAIINNWKNVYMPKEQELENENKVVLNELKSFYGGTR